MRWIDSTTLKIRRGEGPAYSLVRRVTKGLLYANMPLPAFLKPLYRGLYQARFLVHYAARWAVTYFFREPAFRARCASAGRNLHVWLLPDVAGHPEIHIGNNVSFFGRVGIASGRVFDHARVFIGNGVDLGHNVQIVANKEVVIEDDVNIANNVRIADTDAHPRDPELRAQNFPPGPEEVKPIRICRRAWLGQGSLVMKGVTIGEGAIIGANSVVITDIPPFSVAIGNPARVVVKDTRTNTKSPQPPGAVPVTS